MITHIITQDILGDFHMTTKENAEAFVSDARKQWDFTKANGFKTEEDVLQYVETFFHIKRENVELKIQEDKK